MTDNRANEVILIRQAYKNAEDAVRKIGTLLRTTDAGHYAWARKHKTAVSGLCALLEILWRNVPTYRDE